MSQVKKTKPSTMVKFKKNLGWLASSPRSIALIFSLVVTVVGGSAMYYAEYTREPGAPSMFKSDCNMWNRC